MSNMEKIKLEENKVYHIDKGYRTGGRVKLIKFYGEHYCLVEDIETKERWETMNYRLSECIEPPEPSEQKPLSDQSLSG